MTRAAVRAHADELEHVAGLLGVVERAEVVGLVAAPISLERGEHGQHGVGGGQSLGIAGPRGDVEGARRIHAAGVGVATQPVRRRAPGEKQRDVAGLARLVGTVVDRHCLVEAASEMEEKTHAPGEGRRERVCALRRPFEAAEGLVPVAADLVRLADELLDGGGAKLGRRAGPPRRARRRRPPGREAYRRRPRAGAPSRWPRRRRATATPPPARDGSRTTARQRSAPRASRRHSGTSRARANSRTGAPSAYHPGSLPWSSTKRPRRARERNVSSAPSIPSASQSSAVKRSSGATRATSSATRGCSPANTSAAR